jgi:hypothetical protein
VVERQHVAGTENASGAHRIETIEPPLQVQTIQLAGDTAVVLQIIGDDIGRGRWTVIALVVRVIVVVADAMFAAVPAAYPVPVQIGAGCEAVLARIEDEIERHLGIVD